MKNTGHDLQLTGGKFQTHLRKEYFTERVVDDRNRPPAEVTFSLNNFVFKPGHSVEVVGFIPKDSNMFCINFGKDENNLVLHFQPRFDLLGDKRTIVLNSRVDGSWGPEQRESFFPFQEGTDTTVGFQFEEDKIIIELNHLNPLTFSARFPIEEISYLCVKQLQAKSITLK
ncbi:galectin-1-like [Aquarana catesbeiana]|uniref:galectin-1-like n=1 Tax=Aquarana catesbeiana TaxID=8400 RepID=UPI003CCA5DD2